MIYQAYINAGYSKKDAKKAAQKYIWYSIPDSPSVQELKKAGYNGIQVFWRDTDNNHLRSNVFNVQDEQKARSTQAFLNNFNNLEEGTYKWNGKEWVRQ